MSFFRTALLFSRQRPFNGYSKRFASYFSHQKSSRLQFLLRSEVMPNSKPQFTTSPYNEATKTIKDQAKLVGKITVYTTVSVTAAVALIWQLSHWYIEYVVEPTPPELGYQARNLLHGAYVREHIAPDYGVAAFYVREALRIALEEKNLEESSEAVIQLRLRLAYNEARAGNLLDSITEYTRSWKLLLDKDDKRVVLAETAKHIGELYMRIQDYEHAEEFLVWAFYRLKENQHDDFLKTKVALSLASLYAIQRNFDLALPLLSQALKAVPESEICLKAIIQNQLSEIMYGTGKVEEAMGWAQAALESSNQEPKNQDCLECGGVASNNLGRMLELKGQFEQALEHYQQAVTYSSSIHDSSSHDRYTLNLERIQNILRNQANGNKA
ncbi:TPR repeat-containing protein P27G11.02 [Choanephora cucurbitarum]|uniref:TPR repeat-containing protein P27G11.02 n=1 Tax=Choanephora cucurbitarum TaxID=101091 RepID=A0A1C7NM48_9FUNG|nr:TPR repeat-containing protein P27G11.02 [Choanephora cucurbitarum]